MTRDEIIRMAREAGFAIGPVTGSIYSTTPCNEEVERFAALVAAAVKPEIAIAEAYRCGWEAGATATRNSCIALCEEHWKHNGSAIQCADAIRTIGNL